MRCHYQCCHLIIIWNLSPQHPCSLSLQRYSQGLIVGSGASTSTSSPKYQPCCSLSISQCLGYCYATCWSWRHWFYWFVGNFFHMRCNWSYEMSRFSRARCNTRLFKGFLMVRDFHPSFWKFSDDFFTFCCLINWSRYKNKAVDSF